uniref:Uncharacterized protein n=1 Tax=Oryza rufipogon TaxID=4529 RepID=A0A0E0QA16_ORYRU
MGAYAVGPGIVGETGTGQYGKSSQKRMAHSHPPCGAGDLEGAESADFLAQGVHSDVFACQNQRRGQALDAGQRQKIA